MGQLAIKGHETRGKEIIEIFKMIGAKEKHFFDGDSPGYYYIDGDNNISYKLEHELHPSIIPYSLAEFLEKFPYKVGDKVIINGRKDYAYTISEMNWDGERIVYKIKDRDGNIDNSVWWGNELLPYQKEVKEKEISGTIISRFICLEGYDFYDDKGNVIKTKEITMKKKKPQYPKNYEECCKVLNLNNNLLLTYNDFTLETPYDDNLLILLGIFRQLKICRDAYWKIAGEQMGLGEPWEPNNFSIYINKFCIGTDNNRLIKECITTGNRILAFPNKEMRDAFYKNFKKLIEQCKELI